MPLTYIDNPLLTFVETPVFTEQIKSLLDDDEYSNFQTMLHANPECGRVIGGTGRLRKIRWKDPGRQKGKRGGIRIIYYYRMHVGQVLLLTAYDKNHQSELTASQKRLFRGITQKWRANL
jgi:mRNA-degrading endonuclease RelE of RelBE toxin-antitoxin system